MGQRLTTAVVSVTTGATQILGANADSQYRAISASGNMFIGTAGVTTTTGYPVTPTIPVFMNGGDDRHSAVFVGSLWAVATATANASVMEIST